MLPDWVSNPGPLTYESGALPIALRGPARIGWTLTLNMRYTFEDIWVPPYDFFCHFYTGKFMFFKRTKKSFEMGSSLQES